MNATSADILSAFAALLETAFAAPRGAKPVVAPDPGRAIDLLTAGQMGSLAVVCYYDSDVASGEDHWDPRTLATIKAVIWRRQGMDAGGPGVGTLLLAAELRQALSGAALEGALGGISYQGMSPVATAEGRLLNGYTLSFGVLYAHAAD